MLIVRYILPHYIILKKYFHILLVVIFQFFIQLSIRIRFLITQPDLLQEAPTLWEVLLTYIEEYLDNDIHTPIDSDNEVDLLSDLSDTEHYY